MSKQKKNRAVANGVYLRNNMLYIVINVPSIKDGIAYQKKKWISTKLPWSPENIKTAIEYRNSLLANHVSANPNITVSEYIMTFLSKKKREVKDTTYAAYTDRLKSFGAEFGSVQLKDISKQHIESFLDSLFEKKHLSPRRVKDIKVCITYLFEDARNDSIIITNPAKDIKLNKRLAIANQRIVDVDTTFFSLPEVIEFLKRIKNHELYSYYYFTALYGLRREECLGLQWNCINFSEKTMKISSTVTVGTQINRENDTKTSASARTYLLTEPSIEMLKKLKANEEYNRKMFGSSYNDNNYIFKRCNGTPYLPDYVTKQFKKLLRTMPDLPQNVTLHKLRTSCASLLNEAGIGIEKVQSFVGHQGSATTLEYYTKAKHSNAVAEIADYLTDKFSELNQDT